MTARHLREAPKGPEKENGKMRSREIKRVNRFLKQSFRKRRGWDLCEGVTDPRSRRGRRWKLRALLGAAFAGMLVRARSMRAVEDLTDTASSTGLRGFGFVRRVPDSTLEPVLRKLNPDELRERLHAQVRSLDRGKSLDERCLPLKLLAIDGKCIHTSKKRVHPACQRQQHEGRPPRYLMRVLRAVLVSSPTKVCVDQQVIPAETNEVGAFPSLWAHLRSAYRADSLFEAVSLDAGFASEALCRQIDADGYGYIVGLKENQPELLAEARGYFRQLLAAKVGQQAPCPEAETDWELYQGRKMKRQLYRSTELAGWHGWDHMRQVWLVRQLTEHPGGRQEVEDRFFLTSLRVGRLNGAGILAVVRGHWGIENCANWTMDTQWGEDQRSWCCQGEALVVLSLLRQLAYNVVQVLFTRHLRAERYRRYRWEQRFRRIEIALSLPAQARKSSRRASG